MCDSKSYVSYYFNTNQMCTYIIRYKSNTHKNIHHMIQNQVNQLFIQCLRSFFVRNYIATFQNTSKFIHHSPIGQKLNECLTAFFTSLPLPWISGTCRYLWPCHATIGHQVTLSVLELGNVSRLLRERLITGGERGDAQSELRLSCFRGIKERCVALTRQRGVA